MPKRLPMVGRIPLAATLLLLLAGLLLRWYFVRYHAFLAADSLLYQDLAQSWLHKGIYGFANGGSARPTLIRLPGYPIILAALAAFCDPLRRAAPATLDSFLPLFWLQIVTDLATCWIVRCMAVRLGGARAGLAALALACLCPFTANYVAVPLTETFTLFFLALAFYALQRWLTAPHTRWIILLGCSLAWSILLRPDQGLLAAAILPIIFLAAERSRRTAIVLLCVALTALPFIPWTVRNYRTFHVFQPLAPKQAIDPWETAPVNFQRWFRTWAVDFSATQDAYWNYPEDPIDPNDLPERAFDSPQQRLETEQVLKAAAEAGRLNPAVEAAFGRLAAQRIAAHPMRYSVELPLLRLANMLLHPRTEMLPVEERWWQYREHPAQTLFAAAFALLNLAYFVAAICGFPAVRCRRNMLAWAMVAYIALRCALLATLDNAEQRYTLEFFPLLILFASGLSMKQGSVPAPGEPGRDAAPTYR